MKLILIRHGETEENVKRLLQGKVDNALSDKGIEQAKKVAERLKNEKIDAIYSSPLKRTFQTAEEIAKYHNIKVEKNDLLTERILGNFEGYSRDNEEYKKAKILWDDAPKGLESLKELQERCKKLIEQIYSKHKNDTVIIVSHGGTIKAVIHYLTNLDPVENSSMSFHNTSVSIIEYNEKDHKVHILNCIKHLSD